METDSRVIVATRITTALATTRRTALVEPLAADIGERAGQQAYRYHPGRLRLIPPRCASGVADSVPAGAGDRRGVGVSQSTVRDDVAEVSRNYSPEPAADDSTTTT
jgi:hypothetical protein